MSYKPLANSDEFPSSLDNLSSEKTTPLSQIADDNEPVNEAKNYKTAADEDEDFEEASSASAPFFRIARLLLVALLFVVILGLVAGSVALIALSPSCPPKLTWWQTTVIYQAYPKSFQDSNDDGIGDLAGIKRRLDYIKSLNATTIWLNPIYASPQVDNGYDIKDYYSIDPMYGTMEDFDQLLAELHDKDMKLIMDFVPNHTSDQHPWFLAAINDTTSPYRDFYIWRNGSEDDGPPNNWLSVFNGSAWTYSEPTGQYYFHQFYSAQPDLNWRNSGVKKEMEKVLKFWLDKGVDGFRVDAVIFLLEDDQFRDEPRNPNFTGNASDYNSLLHIYTTNLDGDHGVVKSWRKVIDCYSEPGQEKVFIGEIYDPIQMVIEYYSSSQFDFPFNFVLLELEDWNATSVRETVDEWWNALPSGRWSNWVLGNHDNPRITSRLGEDLARAANFMLLTLPGTVTTYYGEEIAMVNGVIPPENLTDPRDPERTPMQWDSSEYAGFSNHTPWLPVAENYTFTNVEVESNDSQSMLTLYKKLSYLRQQTNALKYSSYTPLTNITDEVFAYRREFKQDSTEYAIVVINFSSAEVVVDLTSAPETPKNTKFKLELSSWLDRSETTVDLTRISLTPYEGVLLLT